MGNEAFHRTSTRHYTEGEIEVIERCIQDGLNAVATREVLKKAGCRPRPGLVSKMQKMKREMRACGEEVKSLERDYSSEEIELIKTLLARGFSSLEITREFFA